MWHCVLCKKRQNHSTVTQAQCRRLSLISRSTHRNTMIKLSAAALTCARQPGYSALLFTDVKTPTEHATARMTAAEDLTQMGLTVRSEHIFFGTPSGRQSERITMAVVAQPNEGADRWLRSVLSGRPLDGSAVPPTGAAAGLEIFKPGDVK